MGMIEELRKHLKETPDKQLKKEWQEVEEKTKGINSPLAKDFAEQLKKKYGS